MTLSLTPVVQIDFNLPAPGAARLGFDLGLIMGGSTVISTTDRVKVYESLAQMATDGFATNSVEYLAAQAYFAASSRPSKVAIGRVDTGTESELQGITACRAANTEWYMAYCPTADNADHAAIAAYVEALTDTPTVYIVQSGDAAVKDDDASNLFETLHEAEYNQTIGIYSTNAHEAARLMGYPMGATSDAANSAYTLFGKSLPGGVVSNLTATEVSNIESNNGNVYINRGGNYNLVEKGTMFGGSFFDQILYRDKLKNEIQLGVADILTQVPKVPQTEQGMNLIKSKISGACDKLALIGYIAPGTWRGNLNVPGLTEDQVLPLGYYVASDAIADQADADFSNRKAPPIYVAINEAGAVHSVLITVNVNI